MYDNWANEDYSNLAPPLPSPPDCEDQSLPAQTSGIHALKDDAFVTLEESELCRLGDVVISDDFIQQGWSNISDASSAEPRASKPIEAEPALSGEAWVDEIVVTGERDDEEEEEGYDGRYHDQPGSGGDGNDGGYDGGGGGSGLNPGPDVEPPVSHDGHPDSIAAAAALAALMGPVDDAIDALSPTDRVQMPDGSTMTGAQLKAQWNAMSFHVTTGNAYGDGRGGANYGSIVAIGSATVNGYLAHGAAGANFLLLHEIAHSSPFGRLSNDSIWSQHLAAGGNQSSFRPGTNGFFEQNEIVANRLARDLANAFRITIPNGTSGFPVHGY